jgi:hypothetical protein
MPVRQVRNLRIVESNYYFKGIYWPQVTNLLKPKIGTRSVSDSNEVQELLKEGFSFLCAEFDKLVRKVPLASFFVFVNDLHEDSIEVWRRQLGGNHWPEINQEDFAGTRRVMKIVLEQGCSIRLTGHPHFTTEIGQRINLYTSHLEELLYVGEWAFALSEYIARSQVCPRSISLEVVEDELTIYVNPPFNSIFSFIFEDKDRHNNKIVVSDSALSLKQVLANELYVSYDYLCSAIYEPIRRSGFKYTVFRLEELMAQLHETMQFPLSVMEIFYSGLMITEANVLPTSECILKSQDSRRFMYRPILRYRIGGIFYYLIGGHKWSESLSQLTTNSIPFGQFPEEWKQLQPLKKFLVATMNTHDKILEDPAIEIIKHFGLKWDRNVKYLRKSNNQNLSLEKESVGELDIVFIDENEKFIFVAECKHNRSRYEYNNWKRDIFNFRNTYEQQLRNKVEFAQHYMQDVLVHFEVTYKCQIEAKNGYTIVPIFIINAPTLYMYDSPYVVLTLSDLELYLDHRRPLVEFNGIIQGRDVVIRQPYFINADRLFAQ